jgi:16S rRNA (guanine1516-N2)-methyltransferase
MSPTCLICLDLDLNTQGQTIAQALGLEFVAPAFDLGAASLREARRFYSDYLNTHSHLFLLKGSGLSLLTEVDGAIVEIRADFCDATTDYRRTHGGGKGQMIAKAVGIKGSTRPAILDGTAGLGADSFVLAGLGCELSLLERNPFIHALLTDGLERARQSQMSEICEVMDRMRLLPTRDSLRFLESGEAGAAWDVIYLDPMFPEREKSARVKKSMRVFHDIVGGDADSDQLLALALERAESRVVVKRPRHAPPLAGKTPSHVLKGQRNRFDIYLTRNSAPAG